MGLTSGGPHQKPVLLQKGNRGLSGRAASTSTRYGVSARAKGAAKKATENVSIAEAGCGGRMARISRRPPNSKLLGGGSSVPPPGNAPRDLLPSRDLKEPSHAPPLAGEFRCVPGTLKVEPTLAVIGCLSAAIIAAVSVSLEACMCSEKQIRHYRVSGVGWRVGWKWRTVSEDGAVGLLQKDLDCFHWICGESQGVLANFSWLTPWWTGLL